MLRKMCLEHKQLPPSYAITDELKWIGDYPYGGGGNADVWRGVYRGSRVAIKVLRVNSRNLTRSEKVQRSVSVLFNKNTAYVDESGIGILSRSGPMETVQTRNLLWLVGAKFSPPSLVMISEWMEHGTIVDFVVACPETNRLKLVSVLSEV